MHLLPRNQNLSHCFWRWRQHRRIRGPTGCLSKSGAPGAAVCFSSHAARALCLSYPRLCHSHWCPSRPPPRSEPPCCGSRARWSWLKPASSGCGRAGSPHRGLVAELPGHGQRHHSGGREGQRQGAAPSVLVDPMGSCHPLGRQPWQRSGTSTVQCAQPSCVPPCSLVAQPHNEAVYATPTHATTTGEVRSQANTCRV